MSRIFLFSVFFTLSALQSTQAAEHYEQGCDLSNPKTGRIFYTSSDTGNQSQSADISVVGGAAEPLSVLWHGWMNRYLDLVTRDSAGRSPDFSCDYYGSCSFSLSGEGKIVQPTSSGPGHLDYATTYSCQNDGKRFFRLVIMDGEFTSGFLWQAVLGPISEHGTHSRNVLTCRYTSARKDWDITCWIDFDERGSAIRAD
jgi:hypothetical protein